MKARTGLFSFALIATATLTSVAEAHTGSAGPAGFAHPFTGIDHLLAMITVGAFAYLAGGRALWLVPATFVATMAAGAAIGIAGVEVSLVETAIALSLIAAGALVAFGRKVPVVFAMALVGIFAAFHGYAHGTEMPAGASALSYGAGFAAATALLLASGAIGAAAVSRLADRAALRFGGAAVAAAGLAILGGIA